MKSFKMWLTEATTSASTQKIGLVLQKYLAKKLGDKVIMYPGVEEFVNSNGRGFGIRFFYDSGKKSIRFNWVNGNINDSTLSSVDLWDGTTKDPKFRVEFESQVSLLKILSNLVGIMKAPKIGTFVAIPDDNLNESISINEAVDFDDSFDALLADLKPGEAIPIASLVATHGYRGNKIMTYLRANEPFKGMFTKNGKQVLFSSNPEDKKKIQNSKDEILKAIGAIKVKVVMGGTKEKIAAPSSQVEELESEGLEKVAYKEQLDHLKSLVKLLVGGAANALFIAGRGGCLSADTKIDIYRKPDNHIF